MDLKTTGLIQNGQCKEVKTEKGDNSSVLYEILLQSIRGDN